MAVASEDQEYDRIILVSNLAEDTTADVLEMFFESTKRTGGGRVDKIYMYQSHRQAVIVFHDKRVAARVLTRKGNLELDDSQLMVTAGDERILKGLRTIVIFGIGSMTQQMLELVFESSKMSGGGDIENITIIANKYAIITYEDIKVAEKVLKNKQIKFKNHILTVEPGGPAALPPQECTVKVTGISPDTTEYILRVFFENKKQSGGGDIAASIHRQTEGTALITFTEQDVCRRILSSKDSLMLDDVPLLCSAADDDSLVQLQKKQIVRLSHDTLSPGNDEQGIHSTDDVTSSLKEFSHLEESLQKFGLEVQFWEQQLQSLNITKVIQVKYLRDTGIQDLMKGVRYEWEENALLAFLQYCKDKRSGKHGKPRSGKLFSSEELCNVHVETDSNTYHQSIKPQNVTVDFHEHMAISKQPTESSTNITPDGMPIQVEHVSDTLCHEPLKSSLTCVKTDVDKSNDVGDSINTDFCENNELSMKPITFDHHNDVTVVRHSLNGPSSSDANRIGKTECPENKAIDTIYHEAKFRELLQQLELTELYPKKLTLNDILQLKSDGTEHRLAWRVLQSLLMRDLEGRDSEVYRFNKSTEKTDINISYSLDSLLSGTAEAGVNMDLNALDVLVVVYHCCDLMLRQVLCEKLFLCQLAYPILLPNPDNSRIEQCLWSLRTIKFECFRNTSKPGIVTLPAAQVQIVSFVRLGTISLSKSAILNEILEIPNAFFNRNCKTGHTKKYLSNGLVECCLFQPSGKESDSFEELTLLLNLRGDAKVMPDQLSMINFLSDTVVVMLDPEQLKDPVSVERIQSLTDTHVVLTLLNQNIADQQLTTIVKEFKDKIGKDLTKLISLILYEQNGLQKNVQKMACEICHVIQKQSTDMKITLDNRMKLMKCKFQSKHAQITTDADEPHCEEGRQLAHKFMGEIQRMPVENSKHDLLPLQGKEWKHWSKLLRKYEGSKMNFNEKDALKQEMKMITLRRYEMKPSELVLDMAKTLIELTNTKTIDYFMQWMRIFLDEKSIDDLSTLRHEWNTARLTYETAKKQKQSDLTELKTCVITSEKRYVDASLGLEHFLREMGQIYEIYHDKDMYKGIVDHLPPTLAHLLLRGVPLELMDGDAANISSKWVTAVLESLKQIVGDKKVYVLSVIGIQSSGKSTLLNTMFGLNFAVSAGRCTRGLYLQILPVDKTKSELQFDYLLVVDTEGLRSQETGDQMHVNDNMLATLVIGLADLTIVNIKGENPSEIKDVLEIAVHAFLKIRLANSRIHCAQRCIFTHQNVSAVDASGNLLLTQTKFIDDLNEITKAAADKESMENIEQFCDVIQFDGQTDYDRWYFSDCWKGDPPMAPANPGYSKKIAQAKHCILDGIALKQNNFFKISELVLSLKDLWRGVLSLDFVFSFRNSLEIKASSLLDETYCCILADMEKFVSGWLLAKTNHVKGAGNTRTLDDLQCTLPTELQKEAAKCQDTCANKLIQFFETNQFMHITDQWKHRMLRELQRSCATLISEGLEKLKEEDKRQRVEIFKKSPTNVHKEKLIKRAIATAKQCTGQNLAEEELEIKFTTIWSELIEGLPTQSTRSINVANVFQDELFNCTCLKAYPNLVLQELKQTSLSSPWHDKQLVDCITLDMIRENHIRIRREFMKPNTWFATLVDKCKHLVLNKTIDILKVAQNHILTLCKSDIDFEKHFAKNVIQLVYETIVKTNKLEQNQFPVRLLFPYTVMVIMRVCHYAAQKYQELHDRFERQHGMKTTIENCRLETWNLFQNTAKEAAEEKIAADLLCDKLKSVMEESMQAKIEEQLKNETVMSFNRNKFHLITKVLDNLSQRKQFVKYMQYVTNPQLYTYQWLQDYFCAEIMTRYEKYADDCAMVLIQTVKQKIETSCRKFTDTRDMIKSFCESIKDDVAISEEELYDVSLRQITRVDNFLSNVGDRLDDVKLCLALKHSQFTAEQIWQGKPPYELAFKTLWGCTEVCPYCSEPCSNPQPHHWNKHGDQCHSTIQHKPTGITGIHRVSDNTLTIKSCDYEITKNKTLHSKKSGSHKYHNYKHVHPSWDIAPSNHVDSCKFWMRFMYIYNKELVAHYKCVDKELPLSWNDITEEQALGSLRKFTGAIG